MLRDIGDGRFVQPAAEALDGRASVRPEAGHLAGVGRPILAVDDAAHLDQVVAQGQVYLVAYRLNDRGDVLTPARGQHLAQPIEQ